MLLVLQFSFLLQALIELLKGPRFSKCESIIIYFTRRQQTERVSSMLRTCLQDFEAPQGALATEEPPDMPNKKGKKTKRLANSLAYPICNVVPLKSYLLIDVVVEKLYIRTKYYIL